MQRFTILTSVSLAIAAIIWAQRVGAFQDETAADNAAEQSAAADAQTIEQNAQLLQDARDRLYGYKSVRTKVIEHSTIGDRGFKAEGEYVSGEFPQMFLEFHFHVGDSVGILTEVCDGQVLRTRKEIRRVGADEPTDVQVTRKDVRRIVDAAGNDAPEEAILQAELGLGGIPTLLASLERTIAFDTRREETIQGRGYTVIQGGWKEDFLRELGQRLGPSAQPLAATMPDRVRIFFDSETLFPTRILYLKEVSADPVTYQAILTLEFTDVDLNEPVDAQQFRFVTSDAQEVDETAAYLELIRQIRSGGVPPAGAAPGTTVPGTSTPDAGQPSTEGASGVAP